VGRQRRRGGTAASDLRSPVYWRREAKHCHDRLFGGFSARFYQAYQEIWPLDTGYKVRKKLYNLYHILNHFNLFGGGYGSQAERMLDSLLVELR
jgi:fructosamine-3-kinase